MMHSCFSIAFDNSDSFSDALKKNFSAVTDKEKRQMIIVALPIFKGWEQLLNFHTSECYKPFVFL